MMGLYLLYGLFGAIILGIGFFATVLIGKAFNFIGKLVFKNSHSAVYYGAAALIVAYNIFRAFYPSDGFYINEFEKVTGISNTDGIEVVYGTASYPFVHGDYCSAAILKTSPEKVSQIISILAKDSSRRSDGVTFGCQGLDQVLRKFGPSDPVLFQSGGQKRSDSYFLQIFPNERMISVFCNT